MIRDATFDDMSELMPLAALAHQGSPFSEIAMNASTMQRSYVVAMNYDDGYAKVIEKEGRIVGGLIGLIADNHYGIRCAQDLLNYSLCDTDILVKDFIRWAGDRNAKFVQITDLSENDRYGKLLMRLGLNSAGFNYAKVI